MVINIKEYIQNPNNILNWIPKVTLSPPFNDVIIHNVFLIYENHIPQVESCK